MRLFYVQGRLVKPTPANSANFEETTRQKIALPYAQKSSSKHKPGDSATCDAEKTAEDNTQEHEYRDP